MEKKEIFCPVCTEMGDKKIVMVEKHDLLVCPKCQTSFYIEGKSPLGRYEENWIKNAEDIYYLIRPDLNQIDLVNPKLFFLYEDCYHTLLIGRYNASITMMGVLLEALMKERINLKLGGCFKGEYGSCLKEIGNKKLMEAGDIRFLRRFKNEIRNLYQHANDAEILQGVFVRVWPIQFDGGISLEKLNSVIKDVESGRLKPKLLPAAEIPAIRSVVKQAYDRERAIELFNQVYDFLLAAKIKYLKQTDYDEHNKKVGTGLENVEHHKV